MVVDKHFIRPFLAKVLEWISPEEIAHQPMGRGLAETI